MEEKNYENMTNEELNAALYEKLSAEQDNYRNWLESQTAAEALQHAYEYIVREDILIALSDNDLSLAQVKALLQNSCTLEDIYKDLEKQETGHMQDIRDTVEERANIFIRQEQEKPIQFASLPVYNQTYSYAKEHNECDLCMKSHNEDVACSNAIETAINKNYSGNSLDTDKAIQEVLPRFGMERLNFVLANMVRNLAWDGRISAQNREWVKTVPAPVDEERSRKFVAFSVHPGLLDMFASSVRTFEPEQNKEQEKAKPSVLAQLHQPKPPVKSAPNKKAKGPEL